MSFPACDEYKDSGVRWVSGVPQHWTIGPLKRFLSVTDCKHVTADFVDDGIPLASIREVQSKWIELSEAKCTTQRFYDLLIDGDEEPQVGDLIFSRNATVGEVAQVGDHTPEFAMGQDVCLLRKLNQNESSAYWQHVLKSAEAIEQMNLLMVGATFKRINVDEIRNLTVVAPPEDEQKAISSFLDVETSKIDALVSEQRRLIELLKEKRQAVISHAVTKGLNPNAPMKPSGIQWLGDVPQHWPTTILKRLVVDRRPITYGIVQPGEPDPNGRFMIRGGDYSDGWCEPDEVFRVSDAIEIPYTRSRMKTGDLIITIVGAGVGNVAVIPDWLDGANITQTSARIALNPEKANAEYVCLALQGIIGQKNLDLNVYGAAQPRLNIAHVDKYVMTVPPLEEQQEIAEYINEKVARFGSLEAEAERAIELLQERRTALISAAVTGKIDVREFAYQETA